MASVAQTRPLREPAGGGGRARRTSAAGSRPPRSARCSSALISLREGSIIVVTIVVAIYFSANTSSFFTGANFKTLLPYFAPLAILGAGEVFVMILGEIDLSIGAMYLFAPIVFYKLSTAGIPLVPSDDPGAARAAWRWARSTAFFAAIVGISSFVTTLGMLFTFEGLSLIISHGQPVATPGAQVTRPKRRSRTWSTATTSCWPKKSTTSARSRKSSAAACTRS